ncbi:Arginase/deacetylase [Karstenula rhodostoma CBS 690.94]|uniref:Arginase/deacetylase n=1 Tax=Karstenula rhodostoma CBS 690.94 TaxID=1392251 RepID=A0A9P4PZ92_9PLEO|nr:Arginase/deacetylase [Karstenula rhodostoma CBS 690.94]
MVVSHLVAAGLLSSSAARDITFPPVSGFANQQVLDHGGEFDVTAGPAFVGLTTYTNLSYVHCLAGEGGQVEHIAHEEGLIRSTSIFAGTRAPVVRRKGDLRNNLRCGFEMIKARDIDSIGFSGVIYKLKQRVAATGTAEVGGWTTRELLSILDGLAGLDVVGADVVEVAPIYDNPGEIAVLAAAEVVQSLLRIMVAQPVKA